MLGPPGAGKGTQASRIAERLGVPKVASGDLFRENIKNGTELGKAAKSYSDRGALVPDDVTIKMVMSWIENEARDGGFLLDGFPRTLPQAEALETDLAKRGTAIDRVLYVRVSQEMLVRRLAGRLICKNCQATYNREFNPPPSGGQCGKCGDDLYQRDDDRAEAVVKRLSVFFEQTAPLVEFYRSKEVLREVDGERSIEDVAQSMDEALG